MWLQKKFLELFKKPKNKQNDQNVSDGNNNSVPDIFDEENLKKENLEEKKE